MNKIEDWFYNKIHKLQCNNKWRHYFEIYDRHLSQFIDKKPRLLEIGVSAGGSMEMWDYYFDHEATIVGVDINPSCKKVEKILGGNIRICIGDQSDAGFWERFKKEHEPFDIIIDDGSHIMDHQIQTLESLFDHMTDNGVYICEDLHTSYWGKWGGGKNKPDTFIEYSKNFVDFLNAYHYQNASEKELNFRKTTHSIHYYDSVIAIEKRHDDDYPVAVSR